MSHKRMKLLIVSEVVMVIGLIILALAMPQSRPFILPIVLVIGIIQTTAITTKKKK